jgi:geranylgeranyl pyrophosphate synthase
MAGVRRPVLVFGSVRNVWIDAAAMPAILVGNDFYHMSLIHDDLPAMDDDDLRESNVSCKYTAMLIGEFEFDEWMSSIHATRSID